MSTLPGRAWRSFRNWRHARPFWGGLFTLLAGLEIISIPWTQIGVMIHAGMGALGGMIIGGVLILCGLLLWFQPVQRTFFSIVTLVLGLAAFPFTNFGGFIVGTLFALVGGSLAFAWTPTTPAAAPGVTEPVDEDYPTQVIPAVEAADADVDGPEAVADGDAPGVAPVEAWSPGRAAGADLTTAPATAVTAGIVGTTAGPDAAQGVPEAAGQHAATGVTAQHPATGDTAEPAVPGVTAQHSATGTPAPATAQSDPVAGTDPDAAPGVRPRPTRHRKTSATTPAEPTPDVRSGAKARQAMGVAILVLSLGITGAMAAGLTDPAVAAPDGAIPCAPGQVPPGQTAPAKPANPGTPTTPGTPTKPGQTGTPAPVPTATTKPAPGPTTVAPAPVTSPDPTKPWWWPFDLKSEPDSEAPRRVAAAPAKPQPSPTASPLCHRMLGLAAGQDRVVVRSYMRAARQQMWGMHYDGVMDLPTSNGTIRVLKFTMDKAQSTPFEMDSFDAATNLKLHQNSSQLTVSGHVEFYTSKFFGWLYGLVPLTFTPDSPPPLQISDPFFTSAEIELVFLKCDRLQADDLRLKYV
ncbi:DUF6114 domain-containing protein [Longispora sp. K20-0274]|uniref:DUF6114 domain-containing protein n=1 Tax=Longispora sp. K20-0274 TaxID=3088255 RepID=UPI00399A5665